MESITKDQIKAIYALGASLGIVERGNKDDNLHQLVGGITGKDSVSGLNRDEAAKVITELTHRMRFCNHTAPLKTKQHPKKPGGLTMGQQKKVWRLMYTLRDLDSTPSTATLGSRLTGILKRQFNIDATEKQPFAWLTYQDGNRLIEILKQYVASAERKAQTRSETG